LELIYIILGANYASDSLGDIECQKYTLVILLEYISSFEISTLIMDGGSEFEN
jgi:1,4-dihydroxy-2-naphthoate octaprenyltransferase